MLVPKNNQCCIHDCERQGTIKAVIGNKPLYYCSVHKDYAEQVLNYLIIANISTKITTFLKSIRDDILIKGNVQFPEEINKQIIEYIENNIGSISTIEQEAQLIKQKEYDDEREYIEIEDR